MLLFWSVFVSSVQAQHCVCSHFRDRAADRLYLVRRVVPTVTINWTGVRCTVEVVSCLCAPKMVETKTNITALVSALQRHGNEFRCTCAVLPRLLQGTASSGRDIGRHQYHPKRPVAVAAV